MQHDLTEKIREMVTELQSNAGDPNINARNKIFLESGLLLISYSSTQINGHTSPPTWSKVDIYHNPGQMYLQVTDTDERPASRQDWTDEHYPYGFRVQIDSESGIRERDGSHGHEDSKTSYANLDISPDTPRFPNTGPMEDKMIVRAGEGSIKIGTGLHCIVGSMAAHLYLPHSIDYHKFTNITHYPGTRLEDVKKGDAPVTYIFDRALGPLQVSPEANNKILGFLFPGLS